MAQPMAFRAAYSDWRLIKTRGVVQVVLEVPLADADAAYNVLGGMPDASRENWFAVAPLKPEREVMPDTPQLSKSTPVDARPLSDKDKHSAGAKRMEWRDGIDRNSRMDWRELQPAAQAGIRCADPVFRKFLSEEYRGDATCTEEAAYIVRDICGVKSRSELSTDHRKRVLWHQIDSQFLAWKELERT